MQLYTSVVGDTWDSIASTYGVVTSWMMLNNGVDPNSDPPPDPPEEGSTVVIPDPPPGGDVAPGETNSVDVGVGGVATFDVRLHDAALIPMTNVEYAVTFGLSVRRGLSSDGWVSVAYPAALCGAVFHVDWGAPSPDDPHPFGCDVVAACFSVDPVVRATARLQNLGYDALTDFDLALFRFQYDYGLTPAPLDSEGALPDETEQQLDSIFSGDYDASPTLMD